MHTLVKVLRTLSLAILSGGSAATVFAAIVLVKTATAHGVPVAEAAANNAPIFLQFSKVAFAAGFILVLTEAFALATNKKPSKNNKFRYLTSFLCSAGTFVFALAIAPLMEQLLPDIKTVAAAAAEFHKLHEMSRAVFGSSILFATISLLLPIFENNSSPEKN